MRTNLLKSVRIREGLTQKKIAEIIEISPTSYSKKESGLVDFSLTEISKIINICNLTVDEMVEIFFDGKVEFSSSKCS